MKEKTLTKLNGKCYTPDYIVRLILDASGYYGQNVLYKHVIDNSCGDGAFMREIVDRYCQSAIANGFNQSQIANDLGRFVHGIDFEETECEKCIARLTKTALKYNITDVKWDVVPMDAFYAEKYYGKMDFVVGNPPYVRVHNLGKKFHIMKESDFTRQGMTDLYLAFYEIGLKMLRQDGVLTYITPSSFFTSLAGRYMRKYWVDNNLLEFLINFEHFQIFPTVTYSVIVSLKNKRKTTDVKYYKYDPIKEKPYFIETLKKEEYFIANNFYFAAKKDLLFLKRIIGNNRKTGILVKNGYATLCDNVFIDNFDFESPYIIPVVKAARGSLTKIIYPYDRNGTVISEQVLQKDANVYAYLLSHKKELAQRSLEKSQDAWYAFGRSQALKDTYKNKLAIGPYLGASDRLIVEKAPGGVGVYGGLYIVNENFDMKTMDSILFSEDLLHYVRLLGKYKSGGYYTFSSKELKMYIDYKLLGTEEIE